MKKTGVLHPELARIIAGLGHGDMLIIADAGLPIPDGVERIDLAFSPGKPAFVEVLAAILGEMQPQSVVLAEELRQASPGFLQEIKSYFNSSTKIDFVSHEDFKQSSQQAKAIVRSGEFTPYANVILVSGVVF